MCVCGVSAIFVCVPFFLNRQPSITNITNNRREDILENNQYNGNYYFNVNWNFPTGKTLRGKEKTFHAFLINLSQRFHQVVLYLMEQRCTILLKVCRIVESVVWKYTTLMCTIVVYVYHVHNLPILFVELHHIRRQPVHNTFRTPNSRIRQDYNKQTNTVRNPDNNLRFPNSGQSEYLGTSATTT